MDGEGGVMAIYAPEAQEFLPGNPGIVRREAIRHCDGGSGGGEGAGRQRRGLRQGL
jgi:hypothetical protein